MDKKEVLRLVEFCILMQANEGIMGVAPLYLEEKFISASGDGSLLDWRNSVIFHQYQERWLKNG